MSYEEQKNYFETAYNTGSDTWTNSTVPESSKQFIEKLPSKAMVLDIGSGRGRFPFTLAENGFRVIGLEYVASLVKKNNEEVGQSCLLGLGSAGPKGSGA
jgi:2-polyprenyl-3-methyl-5-hydroxy-6-metoxy-1,4-benzoquinol methylase